MKFDYLVNVPQQLFYADRFRNEISLKSIKAYVEGLLPAIDGIGTLAYAGGLFRSLVFPSCCSQKSFVIVTGMAALILRK